MLLPSLPPQSTFINISQNTQYSDNSRHRSTPNLLSEEAISSSYEDYLTPWKIREPEVQSIVSCDTPSAGCNTPVSIMNGIGKLEVSSTVELLDKLNTYNIAKTEPVSGPQKVRFTMGYRADCEKCRQRLPGHWAHPRHTHLRRTSF